LLEKVLSNIPAVFYIRDTDLKFLKVNNAFESLLNKKSSEIIGKTDSDLYPEVNAKKMSEEDMEKFAQKILLDAFKEPFNVDKLKLKITGSMGISVYPVDGLNQSDLVKFADTAMYDSKKYPGNKFQFYCNLN